MRELPGLFGEIHDDEIVKIAWEAAEKRRVAAEEIARERGKQKILDGTVAPCRGYAVWDDFRDYMEQRKLREGLKLTGRDMQELKGKMRKTLKAAGWTDREVHSKILFYPPGSEEATPWGHRGKGVADEKENASADRLEPGLNLEYPDRLRHARADSF